MVDQPNVRPALDALTNLRGQIQAALAAKTPSDVIVVRELAEIAELSLWCRDAGLAWVRTTHSWAEIADGAGISDATLQSRWAAWHRREGTT